jgi:hypothetical protein
VLQVGKALAGEVEDLLRRTRREADAGPHGPGPAEPETSQRRSPRSGAPSPKDE